MKSFFKRRSLRLHILTIFLFILLVYSAVLSCYIYKKDSEVVFESATSVMKEISIEVKDHIQTLLGQMESFAGIQKALILDKNSISLSNQVLIAYMIEAIQLIPNLTLLNISDPEGNWIGVFTIYPHMTYLNTPSKPLPAEARIAIQSIDRSEATPKETWYYKDKNGKTLDTEEVKEVTYDPRTRPWYIGAKETKKPFWTPVYDFLLSNRPGISLGYPIYKPDGELIGISGAHIELRILSRFLASEKWSKKSKSFLLTGTGEPIGFIQPAQEKGELPVIVHVNQLDKITAKAYQIFTKERKEAFVFTDSKTTYIAYFIAYQSSSNQTWYIATVIPTSELLANVYKTLQNLYLIFLIVLIFAISFFTYYSEKIARPIVDLSDEVNRIKHFDFEGDVPVHTSIKEIHQMKSAIDSMKSALKSFSRYLPKRVVEGLLAQGKEIQLGGEKRELTIFFTDIYDFMSISENLPTETGLAQLAIYFEHLSNIILQQNGTIDKYIGDSMMAFWGAPQPIPDAPYHACHTALLMQNTVTQMNAAWKKEGRPVFLTRFGIHSGMVIVGNIGTHERMNYTIMGDPVNVTSRLEELNKVYKTNIIISERILNELGDRFLVRPLDIVAVKGKMEMVKVYELIGELNGEPALRPTEAQIHFCAKFEQAFNCYQIKQWEQALALFDALKKEAPTDYPTQLYIERIQEILS